MYYKSKDKETIQQICDIMYAERLKLNEGLKTPIYIAKSVAVPEQDINCDWFIPVIMVVDIPKGVEIVEQIELPVIDEDINSKQLRI